MEKYRFYCELPGDIWEDGYFMQLIKMNQARLRHACWSCRLAVCPGGGKPCPRPASCSCTASHAMSQPMAMQHVMMLQVHRNADGRRDYSNLLREGQVTTELVVVDPNDA